jgi:hypothetical protein
MLSACRPKLRERHSLQEIWRLWEHQTGHVLIKTPAETLHLPSIKGTEARREKDPERTERERVLGNSVFTPWSL